VKNIGIYLKYWRFFALGFRGIEFSRLSLRLQRDYPFDRTLYENISVGRASVHRGGRPRPPTDMAARDGRPTNTSHFSSFVVSARK
jgi:hypothetical protein